MARSESTDSTAVNLPTDVLTHTLQTMSDDEYGQVQDNYLLRHLARKTVPNHTERLAQLKPFLCEWGHMDRSEFNTKHIRVRASTEREAFLLMLRASGDHFPSILTCTTEIEIAAVIPDDQDVNETLEIFRILQSATKYEGELRRLFARDTCIYTNVLRLAAESFTTRSFHYFWRIIDINNIPLYTGNLSHDVVVTT